MCAPADYTRGLALYRIKRGYHMLCSHAGTLLLAPAAATVLVRSGHRCLPPAPPKGLLLPRMPSLLLNSLLGTLACRAALVKPFSISFACT